MQTGSELFHEGKLHDAIAATVQVVKRKPTDGDQRGFLAELLCVAGELERADTHLDVLSNQDPEAAPGIALFRQLVRAERSRQEFYSDGRIPDVLSQPTEQLQCHLRAVVLANDGELQSAGETLAQAENVRVRLAGDCDGQPFDDLRDIDDLNGGFLELLTSTGKYYWVAYDTINTLELHPPERPRDLIWRRASLDVRDGPDGEVFIPTIYAPVPDDADEGVRLGRTTHWQGEPGEPVRGVGQRVLLVGDEARPIMDIGALTFDAAAS